MNYSYRCCSGGRLNFPFFSPDNPQKTSVCLSLQYNTDVMLSGWDAFEGQIAAYNSIILLNKLKPFALWW